MKPELGRRRAGILLVALIAVIPLAATPDTSGVKLPEWFQGPPAPPVLCGQGPDRVESPFATAGPFDLDFTPDGCYFIKDQSVSRRGSDGGTLWARDLTGRLGGVRPPHILHDDDRVYLAQTDGVTALAAADGESLWHSPGPATGMLLSGDLVVAANGNWTAARAVRDGAVIFSVHLPSKFEDPMPVLEFAGLFVVRSMPFKFKGDRTAFIDRAGRIRFHLEDDVVDGVRFGDDFVLLSTRNVTRRDSLGNLRWGMPSSGHGEGCLVALPGGDLLEYQFSTISDDGVTLQRFDPADGAVRWRATCDGLGVPHSLYSHLATAQLEANMIVVRSWGDDGIFMERLDPASGKQMERHRHYWGDEDR